MPADVVAELTSARLAFAERVLWDQLDLTVRAGEFIAVLGPNGTGKTSLLKVLLGQLPLTAGKVTICGKPVEKGSRRIGYVPQHRAIDSGLSLRGVISSGWGSTVTAGVWRPTVRPSAQPCSGRWTRSTARHSRMCRSV